MWRTFSLPGRSSSPMNARTIELLAPARNVSCGIAAIDHGADAIYIGGPLFGARAAAANSLVDIERLVAYAHQFRARVYVALNTLLEDDELDVAVRLIHQLYSIGVDALIIQDVGLLEADLPPIPLHSSTQMNNRTVEKVRFWEEMGFTQVVLARELSLAQIRQIRDATTVPLEFFVHGALCVSYSGQCYISEVMAGRSANRGQCAQFCRHAFDLVDGQGTVLVKNRHLLSLKDLDLSNHLGALIDAGISSFKIEGRLKDVSYVKNVTAAYRLALDAIIDARNDLLRASSGRCQFRFTPDPVRSFSRGATTYFVHQRDKAMAEIRTPKSIGKRIGRVSTVDARSFTLAGDEAVHNGDGLCFFDRDNTLVGVRVNRVEGRTIFPKDSVARLRLSPGTEIFRNFDIQFNRMLEQSTLCRQLAVRMRLAEHAEGVQLTITDEDEIASTTTIETDKETATKGETISSVAVRQLKKSGGTVFTVSDVSLDLSPGRFLPASVLNALRRKAFARHLEIRRASYPRQEKIRPRNDAPWVAATVAYTDNITNRNAAIFFLHHGVRQLHPELLRAGNVPECALMTTKYCIRFQLGLCSGAKIQKGRIAEPLFLTDKTGTYELCFDCSRCEMAVRNIEHHQQ